VLADDAGCSFGGGLFIFRRNLGITRGEWEETPINLD
jgi:hypothetical protein